MNPYRPEEVREDDPLTWRLEAACREADPELFFHPFGEREPSRSRRERAALQVCSGCSVIEECRAFGVATGSTHGVWGGRTEDQMWELINPTVSQRQR